MSYGIPLPANLSRIVTAMSLAGATTIALLLVMNSLIQHRGDVPEARPPFRLGEIFRIPEEIEPERTTRVKPPPPVLPVPRTEIDPRIVIDGGLGWDTDIHVPDVGPGRMRLPGGLPDGDMMPIAKVTPVYPPRAASRGLEGYVVLEFTVDEKGSVVGPEVVDASPPGVFDRSAINAALRFKYKPRVMNGQAMKVTGVLHRLTYELSDG